MEEGALQPGLGIRSSSGIGGKARSAGGVYGESSRIQAAASSTQDVLEEGSSQTDCLEISFPDLQTPRQTWSLP